MNETYTLTTDDLIYIRAALRIAASHAGCLEREQFLNTYAKVDIVHKAEVIFDVTKREPRSVIDLT